MTAQYITRRTSRLYESPTGMARHMVLIYGDEVEVTGPEVSGRVPALFRGRPGFIQRAQLGQAPALELYFIDVGQGDSTFIVTPGRKNILIDGGLNRQAVGFLAWKYRLDYSESLVDIDLLVLTHADQDHLNGLVPILEHPRIRVRRIVHSGIATFQSGALGTSLGDLDPTGACLVTRHSSLADLAGLPLSESFAAWRDAVTAREVPCSAVDTTPGSLDIGDPSITLEVLGPRLDLLDGQRVFHWFGNESHTINGHSVILRLKCGQVSVLLAGDLNTEGAQYLLAEPLLAAGMDAHVFKAPHHGSHEYYRPLLQAIRPQISVISSGDEPDHGHPRAVFVGGVGRASRSTDPLVFSTEIARTFVEAGEAASTEDEANPTQPDVTTLAGNARARRLFKRRLHGMINVRTDGQQLYAARRVAASYWWESYGPLAPAPRPAG